MNLVSAAPSRWMICSAKQRLQVLAQHLGDQLGQTPERLKDGWGVGAIKLSICRPLGFRRLAVTDVEGTIFIGLRAPLELQLKQAAAHLGRPYVRLRPRRRLAPLP